MITNRWKPAGLHTFVLTSLITAASLAAAAPLALDAEAAARLNLAYVQPEPVGDTGSRRVPGVITVPPASVYAVSTAVDALVEHVARAEGETVQADEVLAVLRSPDLLAMQSDYLRARSDRDLKKAMRDRDRQLAAAGAIAARRLQATEAEYAQARMVTTQARARLLASGFDAAAITDLDDNQRLDDRLELRSPVSGVVLAREGTAGQRVEAMSMLYRIASLERLWVEMRVPQEVAADIRPGQPLVVTAHRHPATVLTVAQAVESADRTVLVRAELQVQPADVLPGQFVMSELQGAAAEGWFLPATAVVRRAGRDYVFVRVPGGIEVRAVTVASRDTAGVRIGAGLYADDEVVSEGTASLKALWLASGEGS